MNYSKYLANILLNSLKAFIFAEQISEEYLFLLKYSSVAQLVRAADC